MKQYSPTSINTFIENCGYALDLYLQRRQAGVLGAFHYEVEGPELAEVGIAFHACVHAAALARKEDRPAFPAIEATGIALSKKMDPERAWRGQSLANDFVSTWNFPSGFEFEHGKAFDAKWKEVGWDSDERKLRLIFDAVGMATFEDETYGDTKLAVGQDYKTGFGVREDELQSVQMDAYLTAMRAMFPDADGYRLDIVAVRFNRTYSKTYMVSDESDVAELAARARRLEFFIKGADASDGRPRTGPGCMRCNFTSQCEAFAARVIDLRASGVNPSTPIDEMARDLGVLNTRTAELEEILRAYAKSHGPIKVDQKLLGFHAAPERELKDSNALLAVFLRATGVKFNEDQTAALRGLISAMDPGVTAYERVVGVVAKVLGYKTKKAAVEAEGERDIATQVKPKWGWRPAEASVGLE